MSLSAYALTTVESAKAALKSAPACDAFWIYCSAADASAATIQITSTGVTLIVTGGTSAGTSTTTFASKPTIGALVTTLKAVAGWKAGLLCAAGAASTDLQPTGAISAVGEANQQTLLADDNYTIENLINGATDVIERWAGRKLASRAYNREVYNSQEQRRLLLYAYPCTQLGRVSIGRVNAFSITCSSARNFAYFQSTPTLFRLNVDGAYTDLTLSSYALISDLVNAINAVAGWTAVVTNPDQCAKGTTYLSLDGSTRVPEVLQTDYQYCKSPILANAQTAQVELMGAYFNNEPSPVDPDRNFGILYFPAGFNAGWNWSVFVDYKGGYETIPAALGLLCDELVRMKYQRRDKDANVKSESIGGVYSYTLGDFAAISQSILDEASYFKGFSV